MKKVFLPLIAAAVFAGVTVSQARAEGQYVYGMAGCGLGSIAFGDKPGFIQVLAATTNGLTGSQTSGISTGTSNCKYDASAVAFKQHQQEIFVHANFDSLEHEMAIGKGEKLAAFATLLGCPASHVDAFGSLVRKEHSRLMGKGEDPSALLKGVRASIATDADLSRACKI